MAVSTAFSPSFFAESITKRQPKAETRVLHAVTLSERRRAPEVSGAACNLAKRHARTEHFEQITHSLRRGAAIAASRDCREVEDITMKSNSESGSAKIYEFPVRERQAAVSRSREARPDADPRSPRVSVAFGGAWYHEAAVLADESTRKP
jgi:hypothetical protein